MPKRKTKNSDVLFVNHLLEAVKHVSCAQRQRGDEMMTHCMIRYGQIIAFDRTVAAGSPVVEDDLHCCPHTERLRLGLEKCGHQYQIVQEPTSLTIRSGDFLGYVPVCDPAKLSIPVPDPRVAPLGDAFRAALMVTGALVKDSAPTVLQSCVQLNPYSCVSTNGSVIVEAWHGFDMPPGLLIPKPFADAVLKSRKKIESFGFSSPTMPGPATFTVWFEGDCWIRTNLFRETIPDMMSKLVNVDSWQPIPDGFFAQVVEIAKWSEDGRVYISDSKISSHHPTKQQVGSCLTFPLAGMESGSYSIASLKLIAKQATRYNDRTAENVTMFRSDGVVRGALAREPIERPISVPKQLNGKWEQPPTMNCVDCGAEWPRKDPYLCPKCGNDIPF